MRPGGGTADTSVSKTDAERCVGSNPTPGTIFFFFAIPRNMPPSESLPAASNLPLTNSSRFNVLPHIKVRMSALTRANPVEI